MTTTTLEERVDVMTDYQMRTVVNMIITIVRDTLDDNPKKQELLGKLKAIRDGKLDEYEAAEEENQRGRDG